ncbi:hypothetical protein OC842_001121 [Tilletia horrida]|uniref:Uncharacterized protein n=1 Tax=Tilletia horrida TaxID=155126 RepID=A0AAN6GI96_9BASI|nr:hypothetical protein OC842_001121 [Tilletia horrida]
MSTSQVPLLHKKICPSRYGLKAAITVVTTVCIKSMAHVHNISLRWALFHEGKLRFNSNLRLVQHCRNSPANSWIANLVCFLGAVVCYSAAAVMVLECETVKDRTMYVTLPQTLIAYALAMLAQVVVTALALPSAYRAPDARNRLVRRDGRCLMGVERHSDPSEPTRPKRWQPSIFRTHKDLRPWMYILYIGVLAAVGSGGIVLAVLRHSGDDVASIDFDGTLDPETGKSLLPDLAFSKLFAIAAGPQMPLALLLHASERLVNCIRDEATWRKMAHKRGTRRESANPLVSADRSTCKEVESIPGLDQAYFRPYIVTSIDVFAVGGACACLAVFLSSLAFWPRKGPQPATYGHLQTIVDLIDEWPKHGDETMYWGHKAGGTGWKETEPVNHAGVLLSGPPLEPIRKDELYS